MLDELIAHAAPLLRRLGSRYRLFRPHSRVEIHEVEVPMRRLPCAFDSFRIALLSDLHYSVWCEASDYERLIELVAAACPDLVVVAGDNVSFHADLIAPIVRMLGRLRAPHGTYAVLGNHDHWEGANETARACAECGVRLLVNEWDTVRRDGAALVVAGIDDLVAGEPRMEQTLDGVPDNTPVVLLSHVPAVVEHLLADRVDLVLAGHSHGGQVSFPIVGPLFLPKYTTRRLLHGYHRTPRTQIYISRGIGAAGLWFRWRAQPEVPIIVLQSAGA
ncbi:MAG: metallophosphoesterase [Verrucomicrobia bacterium]|nr:metallophosphoesterase [Verrucomicrobiota bacterium]